MQLSSLLALALAAVPATAAVTSSPDVVLATFDGAKGTTYTWKDMNDPVMGGASTSTFQITDNVGVFNGTCAIVGFLNAPGFAKIQTSAGLFSKDKFADASATLGGTIDLKVKSTTPDYAGFRVAFAAKDIPRTSTYGGGSFKSGFQLKGDGKDWEVVQVPLTDFSYDWSGYTGRCDTKDPNGQQHYCCGATGNATKYCPTATNLKEITDLEVWAEGVKGDFHLEIEWIGASKSQ